MTAVHPTALSKSDEWYTPTYITDALGDFDLDVCSSREWIKGAKFFTPDDNGLAHVWSGRVWLNPPYSNPGPWMARLAEHGRGTALVFARTDTKWWHHAVWPEASAFLFLKRRVSFVAFDAAQQAFGHNATAPSVLVAYGAADQNILEQCGLEGAFVDRGGHQ